MQCTGTSYIYTRSTRSCLIASCASTVHDKKTVTHLSAAAGPSGEVPTHPSHHQGIANDVPYVLHGRRWQTRLHTGGTLHCEFSVLLDSCLGMDWEQQQPAFLP